MIVEIGKVGLRFLAKRYSHKLNPETYVRKWFILIKILTILFLICGLISVLYFPYAHDLNHSFDIVGAVLLTISVIFSPSLFITKDMIVNYIQEKIVSQVKDTVGDGVNVVKDGASSAVKSVGTGVKKAVLASKNAGVKSAKGAKGLASKITSFLPNLPKFRRRKKNI